MQTSTVTITMPASVWANYKAWANQQAGNDPNNLPNNADSVAVLRLVTDAQQVGASWAIQHAMSVAKSATDAEQANLSQTVTATIAASSAGP